MKYFAKIEEKRKITEKNMKAASAREKEQAADERKKQAKEEKFNEEYMKVEHTEKRINNWREFENISNKDHMYIEPNVKKHKLSNFTQEKRTEAYIKPIFTKENNFDKLDKNNLHD